MASLKRDDVSESGRPAGRLLEDMGNQIRGDAAPPLGAAGTPATSSRSCVPDVATRATTVDLCQQAGILPLALSEGRSGSRLSTLFHRAVAPNKLIPEGHRRERKPHQKYECPPRLVRRVELCVCLHSMKKIRYSYRVKSNRGKHRAYGNFTQRKRSWPNASYCG